MVFKPQAYPGILHNYAPHLVAFEHQPLTNEGVHSTPKDTLLFIGGLSDGLSSVRFVPPLAQRLATVGYSVVEVLITSSYTGWGTGNITRDAHELGLCASYFQQLKPEGKLVLMGHSTGCQDAMEYLTGPESSQQLHLHGTILQASVSDREAMGMLLPPEQYAHSVQVAKEMVARGEGEDILPSSATGGFFGAPCCARRWLSLASPEKDGYEDFFSSDLSEEQMKKTFGVCPAGTKLCFLYSGADEFVPKYVDKKALLEKWFTIVKQGGGYVDEEFSGVVEGATHGTERDSEAVVNDLIDRVVGFLQKV